MSSGTSTTGATPFISPADLQRMADALDVIGPEPIGEWMRAQGYPPEKYVLYLNTSRRVDMGPFTPRYVAFVDCVGRDEAVFGLNLLAITPFNLKATP